jgi:hypothetical protein
MDLICMVVPGTSEGIDAVAVRQLYHGSRRVGARATVRDCIERGFSEPNVLSLVKWLDEMLCTWFRARANLQHWSWGLEPG